LLSESEYDECDEQLGQPHTLRIRSIVLIDQADVEIIKLNIGGTLVDISIKQLGGLCTLDFMQRVARKVGKG
jgi:hypothetical protein